MTDKIFQTSAGTIIDRRSDPSSRGDVLRGKFVKKHARTIREQVQKRINEGSIDSVASTEGVDVTISDDLSEPIFTPKGGNRQVVRSGNKSFRKGDKIPRPKEGSGPGNKGSKEGEGIDDFIFSLSRDEFLEILFEDLELPRMVKKYLLDLPERAYRRSGVSTTGTPTSMKIFPTIRQKKAREIAARGAIRQEIADLEEKLRQARFTHPEDDAFVVDLKNRIEQLRNKLPPSLDPTDLRFNRLISYPKPAAGAVMFCIMDVSGSMDQEKKDIAKRFFILLNLFLRAKYPGERVMIEFIRYHTEAERCNEQDFFYKKATGGTVTSVALELCSKIIKDEYDSSKWNIYVAHASDGDNWSDDNEECRRLLSEDILPAAQHVAYAEVGKQNSSETELWHMYEELGAAMGDKGMLGISQIKKVSDIYAAFRGLFKKEIGQ